VRAFFLVERQAIPKHGPIGGAAEFFSGLRRVRLAKPRDAFASFCDCSMYSPANGRN
jgi:hypothetical protein